MLSVGGNVAPPLPHPCPQPATRTSRSTEGRWKEMILQEPPLDPQSPPKLALCCERPGPALDVSTQAHAG